MVARFRLMPTSVRWPRSRVRAALLLLTGAAAAVGWLRCGPLPSGLLDPRRGESVQIVDRSGELLYEARSEAGGRSLPLTADRLPPALVAATLAAEDHRFNRHPGVDPIAIARAAVRDFRHLRVLEGGSTISQQVAKLLLAERGSSRGPSAKIREAVVALRLEHRLSKNEILALYLNLASYGNQLIGAERASRAYFGCPAALLTPAQAAFLASLPQRPTAYNPYRDPDRAGARQRRVIARMAALGWLTMGEAREAAAERLVLKREPATFVAPHFVHRVLAGRRAGERRIVSSLDAELQREVQDILRGQRAVLERAGAHNVAVVVLDNATGEWLAWEGSGNYDEDEYGGAIDGAVTPRQPGSALKPFTYALAFEEGETPATVLADVPSYFPTAVEGVVYSPKNYDGQYRGPMLARRALAGSENVPAVALASRLGVPALVRFLRRAGLTTFDRTAAYYGLGVTLGDAEVRLDELVAAYAAFARGGRLITPRFRHGVPDTDADAGLLTTGRTAFWISDILSDSSARAFAFGRGGSLEFAFPVAAKTGTSQAYRDNWAIGFTRRITVGVWVGNFDRTPLVNSSGVTGAGPIFHAVLIAAERRVGGDLPSASDSPGEATSGGLVRRSICEVSGQIATRWCRSQIEEWLPPDSVMDVCDWHRPSPNGIVTEWPGEYRQWAVAAGFAAGSEPARPGRGGLRIASPPAGAIYLIDPTLRTEYQTLPLQASGAVGRVEWRIDGLRVGASAPDAALRWPIVRGRHAIAARDGSGRDVETTILVK